MSRGFENIFQKYNVTCEAPQKRRRYSKSEKPQSSKEKNEMKKAPNKNYCIQMVNLREGSAHNQHTGFGINKNDLSLPSSLHPNETEYLKSNCNKNDKMWQLMKSTRLSLMRYEPLDEGITKKFNKKSNTTENKLPIALSPSSLIHESIKDVRENIKYTEILQHNDELNKNSTSPQTTVNRTISKNFKSVANLNSSPCLNKNSTDEDKRISQNLSVNVHYQGMTNKSFLGNSNNFNLKKNKQNFAQKNGFRFKPLDVTISQKSMSILNTTTNEKQKCKSISSEKHNFHRASDDLEISFSSSSSSGEDESLDPLINSSPKPSQIIDTGTTSSQKSTVQPTELDLLLELIEQDDKSRAQKTAGTSTDIPSPKKPCLKDGYEELFLRALDRVKISGRYLKHDKKFGLKYGIRLKVVKLETSYNVNVATVECIEYNNTFCIVIAPEMVTQIKSGTIIEAFFDDTSVPYKLQTKEGNLDLFLEPYKLLVV